MSHRFTFPKAEHLCLKNDIERLFSAGGKSLSAYPLRLVAHSADSAAVPVKVLMSVSKRRLRHAVDRNRAKRQMREAYRLNKHILLDSLAEGECLHLAFVWLADCPLPTKFVMSKMQNLLVRLTEQR